MVGLALAVLFAYWVIGTRNQDHEVTAVFSPAFNLAKGLDVQIAGVDVGKIKKVDLQKDKVLVGLGINDKDWPLRRGTTATVRFGTTIGNGTRQIQLTPGPKNAPPIEEGGIIDQRHTEPGVQLDEAIDTLDTSARGHLQGMFSSIAGALDHNTSNLSDGLRHTPQGLAGAGGVLGDLTEDEPALNSLLLNAKRATRTLGTRQDNVEKLFGNAAQTLQAFAQNTNAVEASLTNLRPGLDDGRELLSRVDETTQHVNALVDDTRVGARMLPVLGAAATPAVEELSRTAPIVTTGLRSLRSAAPATTKLLQRGQPFSEKVDTVFKRLAPQLGCVRNYTPEIAAFTNEWSSWAKNWDYRGHYARIKVITGSSSLTSTPPVGSAAYMKLMQQSYAYPRPPGYNAGKPFFPKECGITPAALDPRKDPEDPTIGGKTG
jgi:virulence factor Mce-like protein